MDLFSVFSKNEPLVTVHKGWKESDTDRGELNPSGHSDHRAQPRARKVPRGNNTSSVKERNPVPQKFEFVNGTTPFVNRDPIVRKLVRAHVVRDSSRRKKHWKQLNNPT